MVVVFLADGFEESEALVPLDILRRGGVQVQTVGIGGKTVTGSHGIPVVADVSEDEFTFSKRCEMVILPGGMPGTTNLDKSETVKNALLTADKKGLFIAAICAAPTVLYHKGLLRGQKATVYPSMKDELPDEIYSPEPVCESGRFITARSAGVAIEFGLTLLTKLAGAERAKAIKQAIHTKW